MRILVVEDEKDLRVLIAEGLALDGYAVDTAANGEEALFLATSEPYDLIILDLGLPGIDGLDVLKEIRTEDKTMKILILSARSEIKDKVDGLDLGANDYLTKPFHFDELEARVRSLLRRSFYQHDTLIEYGSIKLNTKNRLAYADGTYLNLTKKEFAILEYLLINKGNIISQSELIDHVWNGSVNIFSNSIRVHINSLRKKIKQIINDDPIHNKIGEGYYISDSGEMK